MVPQKETPACQLGSMSPNTPHKGAIMELPDRTTYTRAVAVSDEQYYEALWKKKVIDSGPDYRIAWTGPQADLTSALVRINCTDERAPEWDCWPEGHSEVITPQDWADERALKRWLWGHGAGWVIRRHKLNQVWAMLRERWEHRYEYMTHYDHCNGHGRAPLAPGLRALAEMAEMAEAAR